jgi:tripartite-type tricarboxylate transporter receptor subunit TctC
MANVFAVHVPYRGAAPAMQDLLAGQVDFMFDPGIGMQHVRAGKLSEAGLKDFDADTVSGCRR